MIFFQTDQENLFIELELCDLTEEQKLAAWEKISQILQLRVLEAILSELSLAQQQFFVQQILQGNDEQTARLYLTEHILDLDQKIETAVKKTKEELKKEILGAKEKTKHAGHCR